MARWSQARHELVQLLMWTALMLGIASRPETFFLAPEATALYGVPRRVIQYPYHVCASFILTVLLRRYFLALGYITARNSLLLSFLAVACVSIACETIQLYIPTRGASFRDFLLDLFGATLATFTLRAVRFRG
jgi:VanZ family protein